MPPPTVRNISINVGSASTQAFPNSYSLLKIYEADYQDAVLAKGRKTVYGLPVPKGANDIHEHDWAPLEMGAIGQGLRQMFGPTGPGKEVTLEDVGKAAAIGTARSVGAGGFVDIQQAINGRATNPYTQLTYKSPALRQFQFTWSLCPVSREEASNIWSLISDLRQLSYPSLDGPLFKYPKLCMVEIAGRSTSTGGKTFIRTQPSAITSIQVSYDTQGGLYVHRDGEPITTTLTVSLQETRLLSANQMYQLYGRSEDSGSSTGGLS